jgi:hypothetical protein
VSIFFRETGPRSQGPHPPHPWASRKGPFPMARRAPYEPFSTTTALPSSALSRSDTGVVRQCLDLGACFLRHGQLTAAEYYLRHGLAACDSDNRPPPPAGPPLRRLRARALRILAVVHHRQQNDPAAYVCLRAALALEGSEPHPDTLEALATVFTSMGRVIDAVEVQAVLEQCHSGHQRNSWADSHSPGPDLLSKESKVRDEGVPPFPVGPALSRDRSKPRRRQRGAAATLHQHLALAQALDHGLGPAAVPFPADAGTTWDAEDSLAIPWRELPAASRPQTSPGLLRPLRMGTTPSALCDPVWDAIPRPCRPLPKPRAPPRAAAPVAKVLPSHHAIRSHHRPPSAPTRPRRRPPAAEIGRSDLPPATPGPLPSTGRSGSIEVAAAGHGTIPESAPTPDPISSPEAQRSLSSDTL